MDPVLATARELLDRQVCECSHIESEHHNDGSCTECTCEIFEPVTFSIERAEDHDPDVEEEHAMRQADIEQSCWRNS
jgi:hypothetical protein